MQEANWVLTVFPNLTPCRLPKFEAEALLRITYPVIRALIVLPSLGKWMAHENGVWKECQR